SPLFAHRLEGNLKSDASALRLEPAAPRRRTRPKVALERLRIEPALDAGQHGPAGEPRGRVRAEGGVREDEPHDLRRRVAEEVAIDLELAAGVPRRGKRDEDAGCAPIELDHFPLLPPLARVLRRISWLISSRFRAKSLSLRSTR